MPKWHGFTRESVWHVVVYRPLQMGSVPLRDAGQPPCPAIPERSQDSAGVAAPLAQLNTPQAWPDPQRLPAGPKFSLIQVKFPSTLVAAEPVWEEQSQGLPVPTAQQPNMLMNSTCGLLSGN